MKLGNTWEIPLVLPAYQVASKNLPCNPQPWLALFPFAHKQVKRIFKHYLTNEYPILYNKSLSKSHIILLASKRYEWLYTLRLERFIFLSHFSKQFLVIINKNIPCHCHCHYAKAALNAHIFTVSTFSETFYYMSLLNLI